MSNGIGNDKKDAFITLATGKRFYPFNPSVVALSIEDIAPAMLNVSRFCGQLKQDENGLNKYYSLLQHSLVVSYLLASHDTSIQMAGLLHDAEEVLGFPDVPSPVKAWLPEYKQAANVVQDYVGEVFGFKSPHHPTVKSADYMALLLESSLWMPKTTLSDGFRDDIATAVATYQDTFCDDTKSKIDLVMQMDAFADADKLLDTFLERFYELSFREDFKKHGAL